MSGRQFDPEAVEIFLCEESAMKRMVAMKCSENVSARSITGSGSAFDQSSD